METRTRRVGVADMRVRAMAFDQELRGIKASLNPDPAFWYPYGTLANFLHLDRLLRGDQRYLLELARGEPIADIGAGDGDIAFFLEREYGVAVEIVDHAPTNFNSLRGARLVKEGLSSRVPIHDIDLDAFHSLPSAAYGLAFFLGILYHLKNPFHALESLARSSRHLLVSTRIARLSPDGKTNFSKLPVAYLLHETEANDDPTNYWIFSEAGLRRIVQRAGWDLLAFESFGDTRRSDPAHRDADERAFCLLRSRHR